MVYFECGKCNETVKKPKLAKHLQMCGSGYVSCIDCNKVFAWNEWEAHTSCVSEAQKYQGNLYQAKDNSNKGQVKQDAWIDNVAQKIEDPNSKIAPVIKSLLQKLLGFSNIPRKQKPFGNFVKNSLKIWNDKQIGEMWEVIASANAKPVPVCSPCTPAPTADVTGASDNSKAKESATKKWAGWKRALDDELEDAAGEMAWKKLRDAVVKRYRDSGEKNGISDEDLGLQALIAIPENYLSKEDELVRKAQ